MSARTCGQPDLMSMWAVRRACGQPASMLRTGTETSFLAYISCRTPDFRHCRIIVDMRRQWARVASGLRLQCVCGHDCCRLCLLLLVNLDWGTQVSDFTMLGCTVSVLDGSLKVRASPAETQGRFHCNTSTSWT